MNNDRLIRALQVRLAHLEDDINRSKQLIKSFRVVIATIEEDIAADEARQRRQRKERGS